MMIEVIKEDDDVMIDSFFLFASTMQIDFQTENSTHQLIDKRKGGWSVCRSRDTSRKYFGVHQTNLHWSIVMCMVYMM